MDLAEHIVRHFFRFQMELKLYHWRTLKYSRHEASDYLGQYMSGAIDEFIESFMGVHGAVHLRKQASSFVVHTYSDESAPQLLMKFSVFLNSLYKTKGITEHPALCNQIDEMLAKIEKTLYLYRLS